MLHNSVLASQGWFCTPWKACRFVKRHALVVNISRCHTMLVNKKKTLRAVRRMESIFLYRDILIYFNYPMGRRFQLPIFWSHFYLCTDNCTLVVVQHQLL